MKGEKRKRIFITGGSGLLGGTLTGVWRERYEILFCYNRHRVSFKGARGFRLDLTDKNATLRLLREFSPEVILHCAALTDVDYCENHPEEAQVVNVETTRTLTEVANQLGAKLIYLSTEAVYEGNRGRYSEEDPPQPINRYAKSKLEGEDAVRSGGGDWFIARTGFEGWRFHPDLGKQGFFEWLILKFQEGRPIPVFSDRYFTPFSVYNFVEVLEEVVRKNIQGLFNVEGSERCGYVEFAEIVAREFDFESSLIQPVLMENVPSKVKRPKDTSLNISRIQSQIETKILDVEETVRDLKSFRDNGGLDRLRQELQNDPRVSNSVPG